MRGDGEQAGGHDAQPISRKFRLTPGLLPYKESYPYKEGDRDMPRMKAIEIDIDVYRAIEARRTDFGQLHNDILREVFNLTNSRSSADPSRRRTGTYAYELLGERVEEGSLQAAYVGCLLQIAELKPAFLEQLSQQSTKSRRIVARDKEGLYLKTPELSGKYARPLTDGWWVDINLSRQQCEQRLRTACDVAGLKFDRDLVLNFPN